MEDLTFADYLQKTEKMPPNAEVVVNTHISRENALKYLDNFHIGTLDTESGEALLYNEDDRPTVPPTHEEVIDFVLQVYPKIEPSHINLYYSNNYYDMENIKEIIIRKGRIILLAYRSI